MRHFRLEYILLYLHRISVFTQNLGQTRKPSGTSRSSRRESGKSTMFLFPKMPCPPASVPCGSRLRSFSTGCRPKRTSSLLRTSVPAPVCSSTSSPPSLSPPSSCGSTIDSHPRGRRGDFRRSSGFPYEMRINSRNRKKMTKGARREIVRCEQTDRTLLCDLSSQ